MTPEIFVPDVDGGNRTRGGPYGNELVNRGPYENPFPVDESYFLVSKMGTVLLRDYDRTECVVVARPEDGMGYYSPIPVRKVKPPPVIESQLPAGEREPWGTVLMIEPRTWGAYPSKLTRIVLSGHPDEKGERRFTMDSRSMRRVFAWMDLNVPYYRDSRTNHSDVPGSRMMYPPDLNRVLEDVRKRRCADCHESVPRKFYTRITNVEENQFLSAPLAKEAGGAGRCARPVFTSRDDPDYQAILKTFAPVTALMKERPRIDFPEAPYVPHKNARPVLTAASCATTK